MEHFAVGVVGTGYVGLATGACLAYVGHSVTCLDNDQERLAGLRKGRVPFYEPGLEELIAKSAGRLHFAGSQRLAEIVREVDVLFVAVGTPQGGDGSADLSNVANVARAIGRALAESAPREFPLVVVNKSTVPVGSTYYVSTLVSETIDDAGGEGAEFRVASNPEFLREGSAVHDSLFPDRVVVGTDSGQTLDALRTLYTPIVEQSFPTEWDPRPKVAVPFVTTDLASAEMIKSNKAAALMREPKLIVDGRNALDAAAARKAGLLYRGSDAAMTGARPGTRRPRALVTGGAGFIGSHLCERLLSEGYEIVCIDNLSTGVLENVAPLLTREAHFEYVEHDVCAHIDVPGELDEVYHFASPASPADFGRIPIEILRAGALGTHNSLGLARARGARFMLASSSEVYGDPLVRPQREDYRGNVSTTGLRSVYDEAKRYAEALTMAYHRHHRLGTRIVRIFNSYGPKMREDDGRMVPTFIRQALLGEALSVYGEGTQTRSVQYVDDLIEGVVRLMKSEETRPVNIGNPVEYSVREIAEMIIDLSGSRSEISYQPLREDDPRQRCPDITRAREALGWEPQTPAREGLAKTLTWFASQAEARTPPRTSHTTRGEGSRGTGPRDPGSQGYRLLRGRVPAPEQTRSRRRRRPLDGQA